MVTLSELKKQLVKFTLIGLLAAAVDLCCYYILLNVLPRRLFFSISNEVVAKALSFLCGLCVTYAFNKGWTWKQRDRSKSRVVRFMTLYGFSMALNVGMNSAFLYLLKSRELFSGLPYKYLIAFICATGISASMNFIGQKYWVFLSPNMRGRIQ